MESREAEYDAYAKEERFKIDHYIPPSNPTFRKNNDLLSDIYKISIEDVNEAGIKAYVDNDKTTYPGITVASPTGGPPERIYKHLPDGRAVIVRSDGSTYFRAPREGDAHPSLDPPVTVPRNGIMINLGR